MKNLKNRLAKVLSATFLLMLSGCADDLTVINSGGYDDGPATLTLNVAYNPLIEGLGTTRGVDANLDFELRDITVVFYKENADEESDAPTLVKRFIYNTDYTTTQEGRPSSTTEPHTRHAEMTIKDIEPGSYRIYAIANVNGLAGFEVANIEKMSEKALREKKIDWNGNLSGTDSKDPRTYNIPDAMFGYFHEANYDTDHKREADSEAGTAKQDVIHHDPDIWNYAEDKWTNAVTGYEGNGDSKKGLTYDDGTTRKETISSLNRAGVISVTGNTIIHAWLKRTISRLTIGYDGSQLRPGVEIYVKSVRIRDAVSSCLLGHDNQANETNSLLLTDNPDQDNRLNIVYSTTEGAEAGKAITSTTPAFPRQTESIATKKNGQWNSEWYDYVHGSPAANAAATLDPAADPDANTPTALYFMENLQGKETGYTEDDFKKGKYPKSYREDWTSEASSWEWNKDKKDYGTYIEVDAYYINKREKTQGKITYRFMLGQNITDDFNAERNRHYKLTLSFVGDANNPDWHIEYEPEPSLPYFRIPYDLDDDEADFAFTDLWTDETWYDNENWKQSYVWYAYDEDHKPIAEIVKELIYYDSRENGYNTNNSKGDNRKYYQVVTVYPINSKGQTDLRKGLIAQVLGFDEEADGNRIYKTKTNGAKISMYYRYELNPNVLENSSEKGRRGDVVISSSEFTPSIADGTDNDSHSNYWYVQYDENNNENPLTLVEHPNNRRLETRPYRVKDSSNNEYPIVKIGASYWFRENLRTTKGYNFWNENTLYDIIPYESGYSDLGDDLYDGILYIPETKAMYKKVSGDNDGLTYGFLYNIAAIAGSEEYDPWLQGWDDDGNLVSEPQIGDDVNIPQYDNSDTAYEGDDTQLNEWQITPKGWHITIGGGKALAKGDAGNRKFNEVWFDHQYLIDYIGDNFFRAVRDKGDKKWPVIEGCPIKQWNMSGLSLLALPADGVSNISTYDLLLSSILQGNIEGVIIPYWTDWLKNCDDGNGNIYAYPNLPFFIRNDDAKENYGEYSLCTSEYGGKAADYCIAVSKQYLPVRPCRHCYEDSYKAQSWNDIGGDTWIWYFKGIPQNNID